MCVGDLVEVGIGLGIFENIREIWVEHADEGIKEGSTTLSITLDLNLFVVEQRKVKRVRIRECDALGCHTAVVPCIFLSILNHSSDIRTSKNTAEYFHMRSLISIAHQSAIRGVQMRRRTTFSLKVQIYIISERTRPT